MCGRFTLHTPESRIRETFHLENTEPIGLVPRYNIAPSQDIPIIRNTETSTEMVLAKWGLVPHWSKEPKTKYSTINARIETVAEKPAYRTSFKRRRCLIPADGFYEWKVVNGKKVPITSVNETVVSLPLLGSGIDGKVKVKPWTVAASLLCLPTM